VAKSNLHITCSRVASAATSTTITITTTTR